VNKPLLSVVMSVYNEEEYLKKSIESILDQTFTDFEFIIINDGSTDKTQNILENYVHKDDRVKLLINERNLGLAKSLNRGIEIARGKYVARMDAGDISHPERFQKQVEFLEKNENVYILGTWAYWINENKEIVGESRFPVAVDCTNVFRSGGAIHPSIMVRKELFQRIGLYNEKYDISLEFELYMRTLKSSFSIANIPEFLISVMHRDTGMTFNHLKTTQLHQFEIKLSYLPYFFNFWNVIYTVRSLAGYLLPSFLLRKLAKRHITISR